VLIAFLGGMPTEALANGIFWWRRHSGWQQPGVRGGWEPYRPTTELERE